MSQRRNKIPTAALRRLPVYLRMLEKLENQQAQYVSCRMLAEAIEHDHTLVRKDLSYTGISGKPRVGYDVKELKQAIEEFVGWDHRTEAFLVGAGNLGRALMGYEGFSSRGLHILAAFDTDPSKAYQEIHGKRVLPFFKFPSLCHRLNVHIGIIAVPGEIAQEVADVMVAEGIQAIWNFAPITLKVPEHVVVENEDLSISLAVLSRRLGNMSMDQQAGISSSTKNQE